MVLEITLGSHLRLRSHFFRKPLFLLYPARFAQGLEEMKETAREINEAVTLGKETEAGINEARSVACKPEPSSLETRSVNLDLDRYVLGVNLSGSEIRPLSYFVRGRTNYSNLAMVGCPMLFMTLTLGSSTSRTNIADGA